MNLIQPKLLEDLPTSLRDAHTPKRGKRERQGVHRWHPYYAGYAEQFVADALDVLAAPGDLVLDPWNGSGTTTYIAQRKGYPSLGVEINPIMTIHAQAKTLSLPSRTVHIRQQTTTIIDRARGKLTNHALDSQAIRDWVPTEPLTALLALRSAIYECTPTAPPPAFIRPVLPPSQQQSTGPTPLQAFYLSALFQTLRKVGKFEKGSNPTWLVINDTVTSTPAEKVLAIFKQRVSQMLTDLQKARATSPEPIAATWNLQGNAKALPIAAASVDAIITSPPYCTRIDYAVSTKPELLLLGKAEMGVDTLRRATMGAPVIVDKTLTPHEDWGATCRAVLEQIRDHSSKASRSYYYPIFVQYFTDAVAALQEIKRVLKPNASAAVVVQSSYYKEVEVPLGEIYTEMGQHLGLTAEIARREVIRQHFAHINTPSREYVQKKVYHEDVVRLTR